MKVWRTQINLETNFITEYIIRVAVMISARIVAHSKHKQVFSTVLIKGYVFHVMERREVSQ